MLGKKLIHGLEQTTSWIATSFLMAFLFAVVLQVFYRYVLQLPLIWSEQAARYLNMWAMFLGALLVTIHRQHLGVDLVISLLEKFPPKVKVAYAVFINLIVLLILPGLIYGSFLMAQEQWSTPLTTMVFLSTGQMYLSLLIPLSLMFIITIDHIVCDVKVLLAKTVCEINPNP